MSRVSRRSALLLPAHAAAAALSAPVLAGGARAQTPAPQRPWRPATQVRVIVPAAPGGTTDIMGRLTAQHLQTRWGVPVAVENRSGAGGTIGTLEAVRARPDGSTFLSGNIGPQAIAYSLFRNLPYREDQLAPVSGQIRGPNVLVVNAASPVRDMAGFAARLRAESGRVSYASSGIGQSTHLTPVRLSTRKPTWFESSSVCAGAEPRKGTWIACAFSSCSIHTGDRCVDCPTPVEA